MKKNRILLTAEQRKELEDFSTKGVHNVRLVNRARIILLMDTSEDRTALKQEEIAKKVDVSRKTVNEVKQDFLVAESIPEFLQRKKRDTPPVAPKITGEVEAKIIALALKRSLQKKHSGLLSGLKFTIPRNTAVG